MKETEQLKNLMESMGRIEEGPTKSFHDANKQTLILGDIVARAGRYGDVSLAKVTNVDPKGVYLDNSKRPMKFPDRLLKVVNAKRRVKKGEPLDIRNNPIRVGDIVGRGGAMYSGGDGTYVTPKNVTAVQNGKVYLDNSRAPMKFPDRLVVV